ncbi:hypothetical protein [Micromonospora sp. WMMD712]|uniref:TRAFAC clade GTPase domain-containing protein n=1 Tax=Micromonospora sp. WMMD712 TaxID=3016096 RepID=UPI00249AACDC|nr:hypothetical protein [Micromonospora sp. WMMD712]WFE60852.1 hypothetical protein O7633_30250 [Micromonospora sp. WMMD712]
MGYYYDPYDPFYRRPLLDGETVKWLLVLAAVGVYLFFCLPLLFLALFQFTAVAVPVLMAGGAGWAIIRTIMLLAGRRPVPLFTPDREAARSARRRQRRPYLTVDPAWPSYWVGQVFIDQWEAVRWVVRDLLSLMRLTGRLLDVTNRKKLLLLWPLFAIFGAIGIGIGMTLGVVLAVAANLLATMVMLLLGVVTTGLLRLYERLRQLRLRAAASCPACYHVSRLPAYRCPGTHPQGGNLHRALRPGRLGLLRRTCACGTALPVTRGRASQQLAALCQLCGHPLHRGAAAITDVRIPVFGATSSGKTQLLTSALVGLTALSGTRDTVVELVDRDSERTYRQSVQIVDGTAAVHKTSTDWVPFATTLLLRHRGRDALLHLFDAAGENLTDPNKNAGYGYLDFARTLVFVLDPFAIPEVGEQLSSFPEIERQANASRHDAEDSYNGTVNRLRRYGVATERQRIAFVLTKGDLLAKLPVGVGIEPGHDDPAAVRRWLVDRQMENLLLTAERDFAEVRYFCINAKDTGRQGALAPIGWLLRRERIALT